jgi:hypothetical protein
VHKFGALVVVLVFSQRVLHTKKRPTSTCTRLATALFFKVGLLAKTLFIVAYIAHPQAGNVQRWAARRKPKYTGRNLIISLSKPQISGILVSMLMRLSRNLGQEGSSNKKYLYLITCKRN